MDKQDQKEHETGLSGEQIEIEETIQSSDSIRVWDTVFSIGKLKKMFSQNQIKGFYEDLIQNSEGGIVEPLKYLPKQVFPAVKQYFGKHYQWIDTNQEQYEDKGTFQITPMISHIQFHNLEVLNLSNNGINSVEGLAFLYAPNLRCLELHTNSISNLDTLNKADFPRLEVITFYHNPITKMDQFFRIHSNKLTGYEFDKNTKYKNLLEDYRFLFKMENPIPKMIKVLDEYRIDLRKRPYFKILDQPQTTILHSARRVGNPFMVAPRRIEPINRRQMMGFLD